jgi:diguanylate cyclase (GGDEF)-like protein
VISGIDVPLEVAVVLCLAGLAAGLWAGRRQAISRLDPRRHPLADLMLPAAQMQTIDLAARRNAERAGSQAVLSGRIDQLVGLRSVWNPDIREQVQGHVAAVMRAGLRRGDSFAAGEGEQFTITIPGADERTAARIADRLRRSLSQLRLPHLGGTGQVTASFGVAAEQFGDTGDALVRRAQQALNAALARGEDHVITASEIEDIILLPAPATEIPTASAA